MWQKNYQNVFTYAAGCDVYFKKYCSEIGYESFTTFFSDLGIAEWFGEDSVKETYKNVLESWLNSYKYFTEFTMALNVKSWYWYEKDNNLSRLYSTLYYKAKDAFYGHYKDNKEATDYFWHVLD